MRTKITTLSIASLIGVGLGGTAVAQPTSPAPSMEAPPAATPAPTATATASATSAEPKQPWSFAVTPRIGATIPTSKLGAFVIGGLQIDYSPSAASHRLMIGLDLSITRPSYDGTVMDPRIPSGTGSYTIHETELVVGLTAAYRLLSNESALVPWLGAGPVLHMLKTTESTAFAPGDNTAQSTELGLELFAGLDYRVGPGYLVGDLRMVYSKLDHVLTGDTNAGKLAIEAGYRFGF